MIFSSITFLFVFLPLTLAAYYVCPTRHRNWVALAASGLFYAWGAPRFVIVLFFSSMVDYALSRELPEGKRTPVVRNGVLAVAVVLNIGLLLYFKYANFFVDNLNGWLARFGAGSVSWTAVALPIGISFFTFQKVSYLADVYRGTAKVARNAADYLLYVILFPQLIAGPIVRYHDVALQLIQREHTRERFFAGILRFCQGLGKKVLVANTLATFADKAFGAAPGELSCVGSGVSAGVGLALVQVLVWVLARASVQLWVRALAPALAWFRCQCGCWLVRWVGRRLLRRFMCRRGRWLRRRLLL
jgi:alginate O-acetyltransferase complex protein AlgI